MPDQTEAPPRRLRAADVIEDLRGIIAELIERKTVNHSSVELTRNAKGDTQVSVKVSVDGEQIKSVEEAAQVARELYQRECLAFPIDPATPKPGSTARQAAAIAMAKK